MKGKKSEKRMNEFRRATLRREKIKRLGAGASIFLCLILGAVLIWSGEVESKASSATAQPFMVLPSAAVIPEETDAPVSLAEVQIPDAAASANPQKEYIYVGELRVAAYGGHSTALTYSGSIPRQHLTAAAKLSAFEIGDELLIGHKVYIVQDCVEEEAREHLRIYFDSKEAAMEFGRNTLPVYRKQEAPEVKEGYMGEFEVTGYCGCERCCGKKTEKLTKTETIPRSGHTIAVDPKVIALGTRIEVDGIIYVAEDTGGAIKGNRLDIYFDTHEEAIVYGRKIKAVYLP